jgi:hypothetical protein
MSQAPEPVILPLTLSVAKEFAAVLNKPNALILFEFNTSFEAYDDHAVKLAFFAGVAGVKCELDEARYPDELSLVTHRFRVLRIADPMIGKPAFVQAANDGGFEVLCVNGRDVTRLVKMRERGIYAV